MNERPRQGVVHSMMLLPLMVLVTGQGRTAVGLPKAEFPEPVFAGARETVVGMRPMRDTVMTIQFSSERPAQYGGGTVQPANTTEVAAGYVRWNVARDEFAGRKCTVLQSDGISKPKWRSGQVVVQGQQGFWVTSEGTLLRQTELRSDPTGWRKATCTFGEESVEVEVEDPKGKTSYTLFPADMKAVHARFLPIFENGKVVRKEKTYLALDPFARTFVPHTVRETGGFKGTYMNIPFEGHAFEIVGPKKTIRALISKESDLVQVNLGPNQFLVLNAPPESREGPTWRAGAKKDGG